MSGAVAILGFTLLMPEAWWARYTPQVWWAPVLIALAATVSRPRLLKLGGGVLAAVLLANAGLVAASSILQVGEGNLAVRRQLAAFAQSPTPVCIHVGAAHSRLALVSKSGGDIRLVPHPLPKSQAVPLAGTDDQSLAAWGPCS